MFKIGIDVGGTNTDAVIMNGETILASVKSATTQNVTDGIKSSLHSILDESGVDPGDVAAVMLGTTHFTNAVLERRNLEKVAAIRLGLPAGSGLPPFTDWPADIRDCLGNHAWMVHGGNEMNGEPIAELKPQELQLVAKEIQNLGLRALAISSIFSPVNNEMEKQAADILSDLLPDVDITLSHEVGELGMLERENAGILNAALRTLSRDTVAAFSEALHSVNLTCPFFITQNDGTLMDSKFVRDFPVLTFASGPTNSMRGAALLTGEPNAIVVDVGGTTSDVGSLINGFPKLAGVTVDVGGIRTNFRMPDVYSIALGGGSKVVDGAEITIGPESVGYRLIKDGLVFGGHTLTASDIAVAVGEAEFGDKSKVAHLAKDTCTVAMQLMHQMIAGAVERMRVSATPIPVLAVGGGSVLVPDKVGELPVLRPQHFAVANAIGAAVGQISGEIEKVYMLDEMSRDDAIADATARASQQAIEAGAREGSLVVLNKEDIPLAYLPGNATRVRVKVVGELAID